MRRNTTSCGAIPLVLWVAGTKNLPQYITQGGYINLDGKNILLKRNLNDSRLRFVSEK